VRLLGLIEIGLLLWLFVVVACAMSIASRPRRSAERSQRNRSKTTLHFGG